MAKAKKKTAVKKKAPAKKKVLAKKKPAPSKKSKQLSAISNDISTQFMRGVQGLLKDHGLDERFEVRDLKLKARGLNNDCGCVPPERPKFIFVGGKFVCDGCE